MPSAAIHSTRSDDKRSEAKALIRRETCHLPSFLLQKSELDNGPRYNQIQKKEALPVSRTLVPGTFGPNLGLSLTSGCCCGESYCLRSMNRRHGKLRRHLKVLRRHRHRHRGERCHHPLRRPRSLRHRKDEDWRHPRSSYLHRGCLRIDAGTSHRHHCCRRRGCLRCRWDGRSSHHLDCHHQDCRRRSRGGNLGRYCQDCYQGYRLGCHPDWGLCSPGRCRRYSRRCSHRVRNHPPEICHCCSRPGLRCSLLAGAGLAWE